MTIRINHEGLTVPVTKSLVSYLSTLLINKGVSGDIGSLTFNFQDPNYSVVDGGYHPVEIRIEPNQNNNGEWSLCHITDFCFVGMGICAELAIDADFNFELNKFQSMYGIFPLATAAEYYLIWEANFITYAKEFNVFNIEITEGD
jgi:hypothetical protein